MVPPLVKAVDEKDAERMGKKMMEGEFDLDDFLSQVGLGLGLGLGSPKP